MTKPGDIAFHVLKEILYLQNMELLKKIAKSIGVSESYMLEKYLKPCHYLPLITSSILSSCENDE
jgi:hypothetical protein